jgi:hypothetical protein
MLKEMLIGYKLVRNGIVQRSPKDIFSVVHGSLKEKNLEKILWEGEFTLRSDP